MLPDTGDRTAVNKTTIWSVADVPSVHGSATRSKKHSPSCLAEPKLILYRRLSEQQSKAGKDAGSDDAETVAATHIGSSAGSIGSTAAGSTRRSRATETSIDHISPTRARGGPCCGHGRDG